MMDIDKIIKETLDKHNANKHIVKAYTRYESVLPDTPPMLTLYLDGIYLGHFRSQKAIERYLNDTYPNSWEYTV